MLFSRTFHCSSSSTSVFPSLRMTVRRQVAMGRDGRAAEAAGRAGVGVDGSVFAGITTMMGLVVAGAALVA